MCDYIYLPYENKDSLNLSKTEIIKGESISKINGKDVYSPVSGNALSLKSIMSTSGITNCLIIENDFKDTKKESVQIENLYKIDTNILKNEIGVITEDINVKVYLSKYNQSEAYLLKSNVKIVLEMLNLLTEIYNVKANIILNKKDLVSYRTLFSYINAYPNIKITFDKSLTANYKIYDIIDLYYKLKNKTPRDYIYVTVFNSGCNVYKVKKYSNLKELLNYIKVNLGKVYINEKEELTNYDYLLDDNVTSIFLKWHKHYIDKRMCFMYNQNKRW